MAQEFGADENVLALITGAIVTVLVAGKKAFDKFYPNSLKGIKDSTELDIIKTLREELDRVKEDLQNTKDENAENIDKLKEELKEVNKNYDKIKRQMLEVYIQATTVYSFEELELLKMKLLEIMDDDNPE